MMIAARVRGLWPVSTMFGRVLRGRSRGPIGTRDWRAGDRRAEDRRAGDTGGTHRGPQRARTSATAFAIIAAAAGFAATPASASNGCTAVNTGTLTHSSTVSDSTFQVVTRAVNAGLTTVQFTAGDVIHYSYTISNPNGGVHAYYRPTNAAGGAASSVAFIGTSTNTSTTGDVTSSGSGSVTLPANITDIYLYDTQLNPGTSATMNWTVSCTPAGGAASPAITAVSPASGPAGGGTSVTLTGTALNGTTAVNFGGVAATGFIVNSATSITATAPAAAAAGVVNVTATTGAGTSLAASGNQFTYAAPTVTGVSPAALVAGATGSITITGTNFVPGNTSVAVGGTAATGVNCSSATSCTATAPARSAGVYDVVVTTGSVASATSAADRLVYASPPGVAAAFSPGSITSAQTSTLTVTLTNGNSGTALSGVALAPSTLPAGLDIAAFGTTCTGTLSTTSTTYALSGAGLAASASCTVTLTVTPSGGAATYTLTTGAVSASGPATLAGTPSGATLTVTPPALTTTQSTPSVAGTVGTALAAVTPVTASGGTTPYSYALSGGTLPTGLVFDTTTGQLTGTPSTALAATTFTVTASDATTPTAQTSAKTFQLTVTTGSQTISFAALSNASLSASPLTLVATASSGLTVAFTSTTTGVCTVAGSSVALLTTGTCTIAADQPGNANFAAAAQVQRSFTVTPATLSVTPGAVSGASVGGSYSQANPATGGTAPYSYTLATGALPAGTTLSASTGTVTGVPTTAGVFSYAIQAADSQGVPATATGATVSGTIAQGSQTISFAALSNASLSASPLTLSATASSALAVAFTSTTTGVCTVAGSSVTLLTTGTCTIAADQPGNANIAAAPQVQRSFTVTPATLSVTPGAVSGASVGGSYSQANPASGGTAPYIYTLASGALPAGTTLSASTGTVTGIPTTAGAFNYAIQAADSQGVPATATGATVSGTIAQGSQTISFAALSNASLSASPLTLAATASSGLTVAFTSTTTGVCTVAGSSVTLLTTGTCTIAADQPGNANIAPAPQVQRSFTVTPASLSVTPGAVSGASVGGSYSQANPATGGTAPYSYTLASGALPAGTTLSASTGTVTGIPTTAGAFSYAIQAADSQGVPATATGATVSGTIAQGSQTISFAALSNASLSASPLTLSATASSALAVAFTSTTTGICTVAGSSVSLIATGTCTINADQPGNANIAAAPQVQRSFTVTPATLSVTPGAVSGANVGGSYSQANAATGGTAPYSYTLASGALPSGTTLSSSTGTVTGVPTTAGAFSYAIQAADSQGVPATATGATVSGTIAQGSQTINFAALSNASLSASPLTLSATASSALAVAFTSTTTGVCTIAGSSVSLITTGTCTIVADQPGNANIAAAQQVQRSFTVTPASLSVTPGAVSGASVGGSYSQANPATGGTAPYSYTLASGALPAGTTLGASTGTVTGVPTTAGAFSYAIQAADSQGVPATATGATVSGTIAQGSQTISFAALSNASLSASPLTLSATASSGLTVAFTSATTGVCSVTGTSVTLLTTGTCTIAADQPGNADITAAPQVQRSFEVTASAPIVADRNGVTIGYDSTGTPIDLASSVSGTVSSLSIASPPAHGTAALSGTVVTYAPTTGYFGPDTFTVTATGPGGTSPAGTVRLTVATPAAPVTTPLAQTVPVTTTTSPQGTEINLSDHVTGLFTTIEISRAPQNGEVILTASAVSASSPSDPTTATLRAVTTPVIAVYTPRRGYVGTDTFQFVAVGPGGRSAPGTVSLTITGTRPTARAKQAAVGDGQLVLIDLTGDATEGPFTGAALVSVSPAESAATAVIETGPVGNRTYQLSVTPKPRFGGTIAIGYTLTNAYGTSDPAIVTVTVTARPDPSADPTVRAISDAQSETTRRFAQTQIGNFMRRNERLHTPASGRGDPLGFTLNARDGRGQAFDPRFDHNDLDVLDRFSGAKAASGSETGRFPTSGQHGGSSEGARHAGLVNAAQSIGANGIGSTAAPDLGTVANTPDGRTVGGLAVWTGGAIEIGTRDATTRRDKITASTQGLSGGVDMRIGDTATVGIGGGYGADLSEINGSAGRVRATTSAIAAYGSLLPFPGVFVDGVLGYGGLDFSTRRLVDNRIATGERDGSMWFGALSTGLDRDTGALLWSVYGTLQWLDATLGSYVEGGAGRLDLRFDARHVGSLSSVLGGRIGLLQKLSFGSVAPQIRGEWQHEFNGSSIQRLDYADILEPSYYGISTLGWQRDVFTLSLGSTWVLPRDWGLDFEVGVRGASGQTAGQLRGQVTKKF